MSRYRGNDDTCACCGMRYRELRTGFTFRDVFLMFWVWSDDHREWKNKRRRTVLGKWHQIKRELWEYHQATCDGSILTEDCEVPF